MKKFRGNNKGFTLVELIIVIAILAILAVVVAPQYIKYVEKSRISADVDAVAAVEQAINVLCTDGTITEKCNVIWTKASGVITCTHSSNGAAWAGKINEIIGKAYVGKSSKAENVTFTIEFTDGVPTITPSPNYSTWAN